MLNNWEPSHEQIMKHAVFLFHKDLWNVFNIYERVREFDRQIPLQFLPLKKRFSRPINAYLIHYLLYSPFRYKSRNDIALLSVLVNATV